MNPKRRLTAEDLYLFQTISDPQISPDGHYVIFCQQWVEQKSEKKYTNLWLVSTDGQHPARQFTYGKQSDTHPRWSPDGQQIAFLSNRGDEKQAQIYLIPLHGGEARPLTNFTGSCANLAWSPDGRSLVCQFRKKDTAVLEREKDEQKKKLGVISRHITRVDFRMDGAGYTPEEKWHIWLIDADSGETTALTDGEFDETEPAWSPDGQAILFISNRHPRSDFDLDATDLYTVPVTGGDMQQIPARYGRKFGPAFSPDGQWISYLGRPQIGKWYQNAYLYVTPTNGAAESRCISTDLDLHLSSVTLGDVGGSPPLTTPVWSQDGQRLFCMASRHGRQPLLTLSTQGEAVTLADDGIIGPFSLNADQSKVAYIKTTLTDPDQIWMQNLRDGKAVCLTQVNQTWLAEVNLGHTEEVWCQSVDGTPLHGWITFPPDFDPTRQYPSILEIHGGPQTQYGRVWMHEFHFLAAQDFVVYYSNPRGSQGYGEAFAGAIYGRWGTVDYEDVMAWTDYVAAQPYIDTAHMGVIGGSYGGFMTSLIIGKTHRFQAAVALRAVTNVISFYGSSDLNWGAEYLMGVEQPPWEALTPYWDMSPMKYIGNARTPTLIMHSEQDMRCDKEQGEQVFVALRRLGVDAELVLFPEESHGLSRNGRTDRRVVRLHHIQRWFETYLK